MINLDEIKPQAIARLKTREDAETIAKDLGVSVAVIEEWAGSITIADLVDARLNDVAIASAYDLMLENPRTEDELKTAIVSVAVSISEKINESMAGDKYDFVQAKALNMAADTVAKLWNSVFSKGSVQIGVKTTTDGDVSSTEVVMFSGTMRD